MRVKFRNSIGGYTGNIEDMIYYIDKRTGLTFGRKMFELKNHPCHPAFRSIQQQIFEINPSPDYAKNLKDYITEYNLLPVGNYKPLRTWTNVYNKLMFAMQKAMPETVDLHTITREQVFEQNLPCKTLKAAIEAGLLPQVNGYEVWQSEI